MRGADAGGSTMGVRDDGVPGRIDAGPRCLAPTEGFGRLLGEPMAPTVSLARCDGSPFALYAPTDRFCDARYTMLLRLASWCEPCVDLAQTIADGELDEYAALGVRILALVDEDVSRGDPTAADCARWEQSFDGPRAIETVVLLDPDEELGTYFPPGELGYPGALIIDDVGAIRDRATGFSPELGEVKRALDRALGR